MIYKEAEIQEKVCYLIVFSDIHFGDRSFTKKSESLLRKNIKFVKDHKNARVLLNGDIFNVATRVSKTSPFEQTHEQEFDRAIEFFNPIKDKIIGMTDGNHEFRLEDFANFSITNTFCKALNISYLGYSAIINFKVFKRPDGRRYMQSYLGYFHHGYGGGGGLGGKLNKVDRMRNIVPDADFYVGSHTHQMFQVPISIIRANVRKKKIEVHNQMLINSGSYLDWNGAYAERMGLAPVTLGSPKITLSGTTHNIKVEI